jgi:hypothetical protein
MFVCGNAVMKMDLSMRIKHVWKINSGCIQAKQVTDECKVKCHQYHEMAIYSKPTMKDFDGNRHTCIDLSRI